MGKNGRQEYVIKLLGLKDDKKLYGFKRKEQVRWEVDFYKKFYETLQFRERDKDGDKIFKYFIENNITLNSLFKRSVAQKDQLFMLDKLYWQQKQYGELKKMNRMFELENFEMSDDEQEKEKTSNDKASEIEMWDFKDRMIDMMEYNGRNLADDGKTFEEYIRDITDRWNIMVYYYNGILELLLDPKQITIRKKLKEGFELEKQYYARIKENKTTSDWTETDNIFLNLYMYVRNRYMKRFYVGLLPDYSLFSDIKNYNYNLKKEYYSLPDLAYIYAGMLGKNNEDECRKIRQNMIKTFQKVKYVKKFKRDINKTDFGLQEVARIPLENDSINEPKNYNISHEELAEALSVYLFFRRNHKEKDYTTAELDILFKDVYGKMLFLLVEYYSSSSVNFTFGIEHILEELVNYYKGEFYEVFTSLNNRYQMAMLDELLMGMQRIYTYASTGYGEECVWGIRNREANI